MKKNIFLLILILSVYSSDSSKAFEAATKLNNAYTSLKTREEYKKLVHSRLMAVETIKAHNMSDLQILLFSKRTPGFRATNVTSAVFSDAKMTLTYRVRNGDVEIIAKKIDGQWMFVSEKNFL
ncbi:unnamed protein product [Caenorhabditis angaria]|uniref:DUF38 domain-containing protein n=1 Tax=Caenorhabditis angaria TaxID=860376 RepID=A0A9P1MXX3_9PELO|nr:unnamed protein product [Caenorhabditis angaria]